MAPHIQFKAEVEIACPERHILPLLIKSLTYQCTSFHGYLFLDLEHDDHLLIVAFVFSS